LKARRGPLVVSYFKGHGKGRGGLQQGSGKLYESSGRPQGTNSEANWGIPAYDTREKTANADLWGIRLWGSQFGWTGTLGKVAKK